MISLLLNAIHFCFFLFSKPRETLRIELLGREGDPKEKGLYT